MALVGNISEYEFGLANFLEANFLDEDSFELRTTPKPSRIDIIKKQSIDEAVKKYLLDSGVHQVKTETVCIDVGSYILFIAWIEPDGYLGTFKDMCYDYCDY